MPDISSFLVVGLMSSIALGVGSSTLAVASFLTALRNGEIDSSERQMLGVIYHSLRVAMVLLAVILLCLGLFYPDTIKSSGFLWTLLFFLTLNSFLMTKHWISFKIGPAFQAATWYTFGFVSSIEAFAIFPLTWTNFGMLYAVDIVLALVIINTLLRWLR